MNTAFNTPQFQDKNQELRVRLAARKLPEHKYRLIADWLEVYTYILPASRVFPTGMCWQHLNSTSRVHAYYLWLTYIESTLSSSDQLCLYNLLLIQELETSHIHPS